jgi:GntR family transcriptional repressor for pyruvate dehydrogenase complex
VADAKSTLWLLEIQRRETVTTEIARKLLDYLLAGHLAPGHRLPSERQLAQDLGVGRSIVREALKSLTLLGIVEVRQGDGTFLRSTESELLPHAIEWGLLLGTRRTKDVIEARRYIEPIVAGLAAERRDEDAIPDLERHLKAMYAADGDPDAFVAADIAFHLRLAEAARNEAFLQILTSIRTLLQAWINRNVSEAERVAILADEHTPIYEAIVAGDPVAARDAMEDHMTRALERLERSLPAHEPVTADGAKA